ncbi:PDR/VanB family oxidoreductase [Pseudonocardia benzenivorans]|uniref:PDR/VanB family oxidoreductase n=1 Tax=Pseudonocardia benzenivorans TaxID=228005 RepID=A0ABW3VVE6_9PSEU
MNVRTPEPELDLVVVDRTVVAAAVVSLALEDPDGAPLPSWRPGAHLDLLLPDDLVRQYSLCGSPADTGSYRVAVLRETAGRGGSVAVHERLRVGDRVRVRGPRNHFPLEPAREYLFLAGGIGITPLLPMIEEVAAGERPWRLYYGGRTHSSMAFAQQLVAEHPEHVTLVPQDEQGPLDLDALLAALRPGTAVYCCGPEGLLAAVEERCGRESGTNLHLERFAPKQDVLGGPESTFTVELAESGMTLEVPPGRSILEVAEEAGVFVMSSCQEGTCGTCETKVLAGTPEHRDSVLSDEEHESGRTMMVCVSRAKSDGLVLDL